MYIMQRYNSSQIQIQITYIFRLLLSSFLPSFIDQILGTANFSLQRFEITHNSKFTTKGLKPFAAKHKSLEYVFLSVKCDDEGILYNPP